jgi:ABC-type glycerol-3-phosphate transport system substrate-binding protein
VAIEYVPQSTVLWEKAGKVVPPFNEKYPHIKVNVTAGDQSALVKLKTLTAAGTPPDATWVNIADMPGLVETGILGEVDKYLARDWKAMDGDDVYPGA